MSLDPTTHMTVDNTVGAALVGALCAAALYGVSCVQTWWYFTRYSTDVWYIKSLVLLAFVFDTVHQVLISHTVYYYVVSNYNNPGILLNMTWSILLEVLFNGLIGLLVQGFLTMRVWKLSNKCRWLTVLITGFVISEFACSVAFTAKSLELSTWRELSSLKPLSMTVNVLGAAADVIIAAGLFFYLQRSRTGFKKSDTMISKLILFAVSTGMLTSICAIASLISIVVWGDTLIYVAFYFRQTYSNSLLATLNARKDIRDLIDDPESLSFSLQTRSKSVHNRTYGSQRPNNISVQIETIQERVREQEQRSREEDDLRESVRLSERFLERGSWFSGRSSWTEGRRSWTEGRRSRAERAEGMDPRTGERRGSLERRDKRSSWRSTSSESDYGCDDEPPRFPPGTPLGTPPGTPGVNADSSARANADASSAHANADALSARASTRSPTPTPRTPEPQPQPMLRIPERALHVPHLSPHSPAECYQTPFSGHPPSCWSPPNIRSSTATNSSSNTPDPSPLSTDALLPF
ncbi:hypothetical protein BD626DRAFT_565306 [Schizophyllum amplum]|uniref:DUF6534 domain-containing protein n=1 Tax=Schizophyllum amplum TaxID=97359 RepID=A0A550CUK5_9AGAR|nr:hypothetical protein BD626DRAFT_565306 [Auriculariopsis ampla]